HTNFAPVNYPYRLLIIDILGHSYSTRHESITGVKKYPARIAHVTRLIKGTTQFIRRPTGHIPRQPRRGRPQAFASHQPTFQPSIFNTSRPRARRITRHTHQLPRKAIE